MRDRGPGPHGPGAVQTAVLLARGGDVEALAACGEVDGDGGFDQGGFDQGGFDQGGFDL
ncbi:hypothetical protein [Saccharopolyspora pogona]|uniref:hypothetical protein n=1 Tax=Saccharopolyspora pogona TaxID=333966 RepID=UPI001CC23E12|nr:hypothetical protein [Saccharopolyspora pogona]